MGGNNNYQAENITVLEGLEAVRKRPGMYIGSTSERGLHHLVWEIVDNSVDEALAGHCSEIFVSILPDNIIEVSDNGRGIPVGIHPKYGKSALEVVLTVLHAGGKFENDNYKVSGGLHGVGASCVNALSTHLKAVVHREGKAYEQEFSEGKPLYDCRETKTTQNYSGTIITFKPDSTIFETTEYKYVILKERLKELAYLNKGLTITISDKRDSNNIIEDKFNFLGGVKDYLKEIEEGKTNIMGDVFFCSGSDEATKTEVEVAVTYNMGSMELVRSFVNNINTQEGGTHVTGLRTALTRIINDVAKTQGLIKDKDGKLQGSDIREGFSAIVSVKLTQPQFEGQTKTKLGNTEAQTIVNNVFGNMFKMYLEDNPLITKIIVEKILNSKKAREAAQRARDLVLRKTCSEFGGLPGKLADCSSKNPDECEVYIVEGKNSCSH